MVKFLKLITSEEIIADVSVADQKAIIKNPVRLAMTQEGVAMIPFIPFLKSDKVEIDLKDILFEGELEQEIKNAYNNKFGSGIVTSGAMPPSGPSDFKISD